MKKIIRVGTVKEGKFNADLFCKIEIEDGKLSISGVVGPKSNGDALGSCGQIDMGFKHRNLEHDDSRHSHPITPEEITFAPGWDKEKWFDFLEVWKLWHLNNMKAGCEHMTGPAWNPSKPITLFYFRTSPKTDEAISEAKNRCKRLLLAGKSAKYTREEMRLLKLPEKITMPINDLPAGLAKDYVPNGPQYKGDTYNRASESKTAGWVEASEHPEGILNKPCQVCGYKYGTEWRKVELPSSVIDFLHGLPDTDKTPAWV